MVRQQWYGEPYFGMFIGQLCWNQRLFHIAEFDKFKILLFKESLDFLPVIQYICCSLCSCCLTCQLTSQMHSKIFCIFGFRDLTVVYYHRWTSFSVQGESHSCRCRFIGLNSSVFIPILNLIDKLLRLHDDEVSVWEGYQYGCVICKLWQLVLLATGLH